LATRRGNDKAILFQKNKNAQNHLYDLEKDLSETTNLYKDNKAQFEKQQQEVKAWNNELKDPVFKGLIMAKKENRKKQQAYRKEKYD